MTPASARSLLFITRKYPPARGGMEVFSHQLAANYPGPIRVVALRRSQAWLPAFLIRALVAAFRERGTAEHVHLGDGMLAPLGPLVARLARCPVSVTLHGQEVTRRGGGLYRHLLARSFRAMHGGLVAVSSYTADESRRLFGVTPVVVANGVDVDRFGRIARATDARRVRARFGLPETGPIVVTVGRLVRRKGVAWFACQVLPTLPADLCYVVAGDGPDRPQVEAAAAGDQRIRLLPNLGDADVDALYSIADLFVAPNVTVPDRPEGYGIAPAEAAAAGLPVLASRLEGLVDMAGNAGVLLVEPGDAAAWANAVTAMLARPSAGRHPPRGWDRVAADYARFFLGMSTETSVATRGAMNAPR